MRKHRYRITIRGMLGEAGREAFENFKVKPDGIDTVLTCDMDQAALHGALHRIQSLGLELLALSRPVCPER